jgi:hypothetical protein
MNFIGALGGIGQGITAGIKDQQDQQLAKQNRDMNDLRMQQVQAGINAARIAQIDNMDERRFGQELTKKRAQANEVDPFTGVAAGMHGDVQDNEALAGFYATKGKMGEAAKYRKQAEVAQTEGMSTFGRNFLSGMDPEQARSIYDATGSHTLPKGTITRDAKDPAVAIFTDENGVATHVNMLSMERYLLDVEKRGKVDKTAAETRKDNAEADIQPTIGVKNTAAAGLDEVKSKDIAAQTQSEIDLNEANAYHARQQGKHAGEGTGSDRGIPFNLPDGTTIITNKDGTVQQYVPGTTGTPAKNPLIGSATPAIPATPPYKQTVGDGLPERMVKTPDGKTIPLSQLDAHLKESAKNKPAKIPEAAGGTTVSAAKPVMANKGQQAANAYKALQQSGLSGGMFTEKLAEILKIPEFRAANPELAKINDGHMKDIADSKVAKKQRNNADVETAYAAFARSNTGGAAYMKGVKAFLDIPGFAAAHPKVAEEYKKSMAKYKKIGGE